VLLHFGAVDQTCTVTVNGTVVGSHTGGYLPFTLDITDHLAGARAELEVRVRDLSETGPHARGKQRLDRGTIWYTAQSGIWQTVWLEAVPTAYVAALTLVPDLPAGTLDVTVVCPDPEAVADITVRDGDRVVGASRGRANEVTRIALADVHPWSPEDPHLYDVEVTLGEDRVTSYAAMRSLGTGTDGDGHQRLLLNGEPYQHVGVLDQGYWPDGLLTPPSDAAMVHDIATMKDLGFTMLRKHVKIEPLRWYHHCDRLGMLVWQDMVNGGGRYRALVTTMPATRPVRVSDRRYGVFFREDGAAREEFRTEVRQTVALLRNAPSVVVWTPFNEGWGQFDANEVAAEVAALDPSRPVNHVSGWVDQGGGDIRSFHCYGRPWRMPRRQRTRVVALTEYGGYSLRVDDHDWSDREFGYRHLDDADGLAVAFTELHRDVVGPTVPRGLAATVYTQLSDVEDELNGLLTWDREVLKIPADVVRAALDELRR
jgi:beta-galactosidase/beta-glucuronidase